jgi:RNA polymerase sigma factor (sigma-70 family)
MTTSTVLVVEDDPAVRHALAGLFEAAGMPFTAYDSAEQFLGEADSHRRGCLLMDIRLPSMSGTELQLALAGRGFHLPIIFLTGHGDVPTSVKALRAGAFDFLEKPIEGSILLERVRAAFEEDDRRRQADEATRKLKARLARLTARERDVLTLVVRGYSNKEAAKTLQISHRTVEVYRGRVMQKLQMTTLLQLVAFADACGLTTLQAPSALFEEDMPTGVATA